MRELKEILNIILRSWLVIVLAALAGAIVAGNAVARQKSSSGVVLSVARAGTIDENRHAGYVYDGYYAVETLRLFGERLGQFLSADSLLSETVASFGGSVRITDIARLSHSDYRIIVAGDQDMFEEYGAAIAE